MTRLAAIALTFTLAPSARAAELPSLEAALAAEARPILKQLSADGVTSVGVLKFLLAKEGEPRLSDKFGTLNLLLARRLEIALVVKNLPSKAVGVIENPNAVAAKIPGASHLSRDGLDKLFAADYPLAWGKDRVKADAFLFGDGLVSADLKTLTLNVMAIDAKTRKVKAVASKLVVRLRPEHLSEAGESFYSSRSRGAFSEDDETPLKREEAVVAQAAEVRSEQTAHPINDPAAPFTLELVYDGKPQKPELRDGRLWVPEPAEGQKVAVRYGRRDKTGRTLLVVLKVNGQNVVDKETLPDAHCRAWVISPKYGAGPWDVNGFQVGNRLEQFRVASKAESKAREVDYGSDVGTVTLTAFAQQKGAAARAKNENQMDELLIARGDLSGVAEKRDTLDQLRQDLYAAIDRGLIVEGRRIDNKIETEAVERDPSPVMSATLHYYRK